MKAGRNLLAALVIAVAVFSALPARAAVAPSADSPLIQEAREAAATSLRSGRLQTELPADKEYKPPVRFSLPFLSPEVIRIVFWAAVVIITIIILKSVGDNLWSSSRSRRLEGADEADSAPAVATRLEQAQVEADELARHGSFAEAMHVLLLRSVNELRRRLGVSIAVSLTSREILYRVALSPAERSHLADIIASVEISYFGPHQPDEEDYLRCRRDFEALSQALRRENGR